MFCLTNLPFQFHPYEFVRNLRYMGLGMLGIFIVIGVIVVLTLALNFFTNDDKNS